MSMLSFAVYALGQTHDTFVWFRNYVTSQEDLPYFLHLVALGLCTVATCAVLYTYR